MKFFLFTRWASGSFLWYARRPRSARWLACKPSTTSLIFCIERNVGTFFSLVLASVSPFWGIFPLLHSSTSFLFVSQFLTNVSSVSLSISFTYFSHRLPIFSFFSLHLSPFSLFSLNYNLPFFLFSSVFASLKKIPYFLSFPYLFVIYVCWLNLSLHCRMRLAGCWLVLGGLRCGGVAGAIPPRLWAAWPPPTPPLRAAFHPSLPC